MQFEEMGNPAGKTLMLLPGTGCTWQINFKNVIEALGKYFHLICVNYDGFDDDPSVVFPGMLPVTEKIEAYIQQNCGGKLDGVYGSSLGGSFVGILVQRQRVHIDHGFLGSSDLDQSGPLAAKLMTALIGPMLGRMFSEKGCKKLEKLDEGKRTFMEDFGSIFRSLHPDTLAAEFYDDLITPLGDDIHAPGTTVHVIYAMKMGKKYEKRYRKHFRDPDIHPFDMQHEGWMFDQQWAKPVIETIVACMEEEALLS